MSVDSWSGGEKKIARRAFDAALEKEFAALIVQIKEMTATLATPTDTWDMHHFLSGRLREIERKYDYRYSQLIVVFGRLMREGWITESELEGLKIDKIEMIRHVASI